MCSAGEDGTVWSLDAISGQTGLIRYNIDKLDLLGGMPVRLSAPRMGVDNLVIRAFVGMDEQIGGREEERVQRKQQDAGYSDKSVHKCTAKVIYFGLIKKEI